MLAGKKLFITTGGGVGDLIMLTPALKQLKRQYPTCHITILTKRQTVEVIDRIPYIDRVIGVQRGTFMSRYRVLPMLRKQDIVIITDWQPHLLPWMAAFHIPQRIGYARPGKFMSRFLTKSLTVHIFNSTHYAAQTNARMFSEALGIDLRGNMTHCDVSMPDSDEIQSVDDKLYAMGIGKEDPFVLLTPYSSRYERDWDAHSVYSLIDMVEREWHMPVVVAGIAKDGNDLLCRAPCNLINKTGFMELVALIRRAAYHVSTDSGPMHVAAAVGTPVISLFNRDLPSRWAPRHNSYPIYLADGSYVRYGLDPVTVWTVPDDHKDMRNITPRMVMDVLNVAKGDHENRR